MGFMLEVDLSKVRGKVEGPFKGHFIGYADEYAQEGPMYGPDYYVFEVEGSDISMFYDPETRIGHCHCSYSGSLVSKVLGAIPIGTPYWEDGEKFIKGGSV